MAGRDYHVWQTDESVDFYLKTIRQAVPLAEAQVDVMMRLLRGNHRPIRRFMDLGCGSGYLAGAVLEEWPAAKGVLVDFSPQMLAAARREFSHSSAPLTFLGLDYANPEWVNIVSPHAPFDAIVSGFSIHHQPDAIKKRVYREVFDLLAPGGMFINIEHVASATPWIEELHEEKMIDCQYEAVQRGGSHKSHAEVAREFRDRLDKMANLLSPVEDQCAWLREIGFADVDCYLKIFELAVFGGRRTD